MKSIPVAVAVLVTCASACTGNSPVAPTFVTGVGGANFSSGPGSTTSQYGGHGIPLTEVAGSVPAGAGGTVNDTQTGEPGFNNFELNVSVHDGPPDTDLYFQFSADIVPGTRGDGTCPDFPALPANALGVLHTSAGGAASAHLKFEVPEGVFGGVFDSGVTSDWQWRLVNAAQTFELRTPCIVLTGK